MTSSNPLDTVFYVTLPENFDLSKHAFQIDRTIPLPVQKKDGQADEDFSLKDLTQEQILAGILTVLGYDRENKNAEYYRSIITHVRPDIKKELSEAAILKTKNEDFDMAEELFTALRGLDPADIGITLNYALYLDQRADSYRRSSLIDDADACDAEAEANYKIVMENDPAVPDGFFNAGFFYMKCHDFRKARDCFETYVALTCDVSDEDLGQNGIYKKEPAQEIINKISNRNLENDRFHDAYKYIAGGQEEKGLEEIRKFIADNPAVWNAWFLLGWGLRKLGRFADAKAAFLKARECDGGDENADTLNELAICQMETGEVEGAYSTLKEALSMDCENTKIISNLGYLSLRMGNEDEARKYFEVVLEIDPDDKIAKAELEKLL